MAGDEDRHVAVAHLIQGRPHPFKPLHGGQAIVSQEQVGGGLLADLQGLTAVPGQKKFMTVLLHPFGDGAMDGGIIREEQDAHGGFSHR